MKLCIEIDNDTGFHTLKDGEYTLGAEDCDIPLNDPDLDGAFLQLSVEGERVYLSSSDSSHSLFYLGVPVQHIVFKRHFQVRFGASRISGIFDKQKLLVSRIPQVRSLLAKWKESLEQGDLRKLLVLLFLLSLLGAYLLIQIPAKRQFAYFNHQEIIKRGALLCRYLAEINRDALKNREFDLLRLSPISAEEGVVSALITDRQGRILLGEESGPGVVPEKLKQALSEKKTVIETDKKSQTVIFYPVIEQQNNNKQTLGMAVVIYDPGKAYILPVPTNTFSGLILFGGFLLLGSLVAIWIAGLFLKQIDELGDQLAIAIKNGEDHLTGSSAPYREMTQLKAAINRLLAYNRLASSSQALPASRQEEREEDGVTGRQQIVAGEKDEACFIINPVSFLITDCSEKFRKSYAKTGAEVGQHLVDMVDDMELVRIVSELIDPSTETESMELDTPRAVRISAKRISKDETFILFEERDANS